MVEGLSSIEEVEELPVREWIPSELQIRQYAEASGDFNPIHLDDRFAREAGLGGIIAHGMLSMAQMAAMVKAWSGERGEIIRISVRFEGMVRPRERIRFRGYIQNRQGNEVICQLMANKDTGERVLSGSATLRFR